MTPLARIDLRGTMGRLELSLRWDIPASPAVVIGPNGAGKTTLLRAIAGARMPLTGRIAVGSRVLFDSADGIDIPAHARRIGYVPQGYGLFPHLSAWRNVAFGLGRGEQARDRALAALRRVGAEPLADRRPTALSGGEQQRVALARALAMEPEVLLLDEPLAALDPSSRRRTRATLAEYLAEAGCPALVVSHDVRDVRALAAAVLVLEHGSAVQSGTVAEVCAAPASEFVREFFELADHQDSG